MAPHTRAELVAKIVELRRQQSEAAAKRHVRMLGHANKRLSIRSARPTALHS